MPFGIRYQAQQIRAGEISRRNPNELYKWDEVTLEAIEAVRDYMIIERLGGLDCSVSPCGGYKWMLDDGRTVTLEVAISERQEVR